MTLARIDSFGYTIAAWMITATMLVLILLLHLLPALLAGMLVYELVHLMEPAIHKRFPDRRETLIAVALLSALVVVLMTAAIFGLIVFFNSDAGSVSALLAKMAEIIESSRATMPEWLFGQMPTQPDDVQEAAVQWLREHSTAVQLAGAEVGRALLYVLIGMILGAMVALQEALPMEPRRVLANALIERVARLGSAFRRVVFAQLRISLLNTFFTGIYLALLLPLFGVDLPLKKTLIAVTFITGLLPVLGNLISNTVIVVVSLSYSGEAAIASLVFLIVIHKLEYFLNARIIGRRIESRAWELIAAMLAMEAAFGISGVIAAPIYYAYIKDELAERGVI
jgi:predicted PurR-regulated permease PerM